MWQSCTQFAARRQPTKSLLWLTLTLSPGWNVIEQSSERAVCATCDLPEARKELQAAKLAAQALCVAQIRRPPDPCSQISQNRALPLWRQDGSPEAAEAAVVKLEAASPHGGPGLARL